MKRVLPKFLILVFVCIGMNVFSQSSWLPEICNVTVDSATATYIKVRWNKPALNDIDSFYIYRKNVFGGYDKIASVDYDASPVYDDIAVDVNTQQYIYSISAIDFFLFETNTSADATTALLNVTPNVSNGYYTLAWQPYTNLANSASICKFVWDSLGGFPTTSILGNLSTTITSTNHTNYSLADSSSYRILFLPNSACDGSSDISYSNVKTVTNPVLHVKNFNEAEKLVRVYPNPASGNTLLEWNKMMNVKRIELVDLSGNLHLSFIPEKSELKRMVNIEQLERGVYYVRFYTEMGPMSKKLIVL